MSDRTTPVARSRLAPPLAFLRGGVAKLLAGLGHQLLEALAGFGPGLVAQRDLAAALALALVLARVFAAAAQPFAVIHAVAVVGLGGGALGLAGAVVGRAFLALVLAGVDPPTDVRVLQQPGQRGGLLVRLVRVCLALGCGGAAATAGDGTGRQPTEGGECQPVQGAPIQKRVAHSSPREVNVVGSRLIETGGFGVAPRLFGSPAAAVLRPWPSHSRSDFK